MTPTLEVRWFEPQPVPPALGDWFDALNPDAPTSWTDYYLPSADPGLNLKIRDDKIQIKRRLAGPTQHTFSAKATGQYEQWTKWSLDFENAPHRFWEDDPTAMWTPVQKTRHQRTYEPSDQSALTTELPTTPAATLMIELTRLRSPEVAAWTFCLEAEGPSKSLLDTLTRAGAVLLGPDLPVSLSANQSSGYASWLQERPSVRDGPAPESVIPPARTSES